MAEFTFKHEVISVPHQLPVYTWACDSFEEYAINHRGWDYTIYNSLEEAAEMFGSEEDVPEELADLIRKEGKAVEINQHGDVYFMSADGFDPEDEARDWCRHDDNTMIVIDTVEEARKVAETYHGHKEIEVRAAARRIVEKYSDEE